MVKGTATEYLRSVFLSGFNLFDLIFGDFVNSELHYRVFRDYAAICGIEDNTWIDGMYNKLCDELIQGAEFESQHNMLLSGFLFYPDRYDEDIRLIADHRTAAHKIKKQLFDEEYLGTEDDRILKLMRAVRSGSADCMALTAYLFERGYFLPKDSDRSGQLISDLSLWNHPLGLLMGLQREDCRATCTAKLKTLLTSHSLSDSWEYLKKHMHLPTFCTEDAVALAIEDRFALGYSKRDSFDREVARLARGRVLDTTSICRLLTHAKGEDAWEDLPLDVTDTAPLFIPRDVLDDTGLIGDGDAKKISAELLLYTRSRGAKRPILLTCPDSDVLCEVERLLTEALPDTACVVDMSYCHGMSLSPDMTNPIIYEFNKLGKQRSVVIIKSCDYLSDREQEALGGFLRMICSGRSLRCGGISLDLSGIIPILLSESGLCRELASECNLHRLSAPEESKKRDMVVDILANKKTEHGDDETCTRVPT